MNITKIFWQIIHYPLNNTTYDTNQHKNYKKTRRHTRIPSRKYLIFTQKYRIYPNKFAIIFTIYE